MTGSRDVSPLARQRAFATIKVVAKAVTDGEQGLTYSELARRLGMSKVNGQGLSTYLNEAAAICAERGLPNVSVLVVSKDSLDKGTPMPSVGSFSEGFYAATGLTMETLPQEQDRVRNFDWSTIDAMDLN